jgi:hypothetical protein
VQSTGFTLLSSWPNPSGLIAGDSAGVGHFLQYANSSYTEIFALQLGSATLDGINVLPEGTLWTGGGGVLNLRLPPSYDSIQWQSPVIGSGFGRFVASGIRNGQSCVFSSARQAVVGLTMTGSVPTGTVATLVSPAPDAFVTFPQTFSWLLSDNTAVRIYVSTSNAASPGLPSTIWSLATYQGGGSFVISPDSFSEVVTLLGTGPTFYWTVGSSDPSQHVRFAEWRQFTVGPCAPPPTISPNRRSFKKRITVTLRATPGATIYYTLDGSAPTRSSPVYNSPFRLRRTTTVRAKAVQSGYNDSIIASAEFKKSRRR